MHHPQSGESSAAEEKKPAQEAPSAAAAAATAATASSLIPSTASQTKHLPLRKRISVPPKKQAVSEKFHSPSSVQRPAPSQLQPPPPPPPSTLSAPQGRRLSYPPTPTSSHDVKQPAAEYYPNSTHPTHPAHPITSEHSPRSSPESGATTETDDDSTSAQTQPVVRLHMEKNPLLKQKTADHKLPPSLKKVHHWMSKGKMTSASIPPPPAATSTTTATTSFSSLPPPPPPQSLTKKQPVKTSTFHDETDESEASIGMARRPSWAEDDRPPAKKTKRGRPAGTGARGASSARGRRGNARRNTAFRDELYCICQKPYDAPRFMIACDRCDNWFHGECIGISEKEGEFIDLYFCRECAKVTGKGTSWKPKCANPACQRAARSSTHQGFVSKYCNDACGLQVARARLELSEMKHRSSISSSSSSSSITEHLPLPVVPELTAKRQQRSHINTASHREDQNRLVQLRQEKQRLVSQVQVMDRKLAFLKEAVENHPDICGFDSRLIWSDATWARVRGVRDHGELECDDPPAYFVCQLTRCSKHAGWQKVRALEFEQDRHMLFRRLQRLANQRQQIKTRMRQRLQHAESAALAHATIRYPHHFSRSITTASSLPDTQGQPL
ncbi:hypothetical protein BCR43DRAFT_501581 [Syncephalastrum racemosum]|uniref:PHD-type domain-containing protein n=1 Tax=Syncephalastrum racemosum TaxID=13706 RepID=A0A1X2HW46_SYNRA|nr:hypothetical protein BCR43DRAFT_501581 [Syncephalastrum racemosum]